MTYIRILEELISKKSVAIISTEYFPNILEQLKKEDLAIVPYDQVPASMGSRDKADDFSEYRENCFKRM